MGADVDIDVSDLECVSMTRGELEAIKNAEWAKARRCFEGKQPKRSHEKAVRR